VWSAIGGVAEYKTNETRIYFILFLNGDLLSLALGKRATTNPERT